MASDFQVLIASCDALIKAGKLGEVATLISGLNMARVPRQPRQALAKICRRAGMIDRGLRLLQPIIRAQGAEAEKAEAGEISEYAVLLSRNGSIQEALELLAEVDARTCPEALLHKAFCHISNWDYAMAKGLLAEYLLAPVEPYSKLVARVNLASAYLALNEVGAAAEFLGETIELATQAKAWRLLGNCHELRAQARFRSGDFTGARASLAEAEQINGQSNSYDQLLIYKWHSIMDATERRSIEPLEAFRSAALARKHWESVREADLFIVQMRFEQGLFDHLLFGTPQPPYREKIRQLIEREPSPSYFFGRRGGRWLDLELGELHGSDNLSPGKKIHQVIAALTKDFYAPRNVGVLFAELYSGEHFNIDSSPLRLRQAVSRARRWLRENGLAADIESRDGYRLSIVGDFAIRLPLERPAVSSHPVLLEKLSRYFRPEDLFSAEDACARLRLSRSGFRRLASWAQKDGSLRSFGAGKSVRYAIARKAA
jgi:predicted negative regulator of RcsB-dependent stress response